jgi:hypothetical protein
MDGVASLAQAASRFRSFYFSLAALPSGERHLPRAREQATHRPFAAVWLEPLAKFCSRKSLIRQPFLIHFHAYPSAILQ